MFSFFILQQSWSKDLRRALFSTAIFQFLPGSNVSKCHPRVRQTHTDNMFTRLICSCWTDYWRVTLGVERYRFFRADTDRNYRKSRRLKSDICDEPTIIGPLVVYNTPVCLIENSFRSLLIEVECEWGVFIQTEVLFWWWVEYQGPCQHSWWVLLVFYPLITLKSATDLINRAEYSVNSDFFASCTLSVSQVCIKTSHVFGDSHPEHVNKG